MRTQTMNKSAYVDKFGPVTRRSGQLMSPENLEVWEKVKKLSVADYLILEFEKTVDMKKQRQLFAGLMCRMRRKYMSKFLVRVVANFSERHLVVWKESEPENGKR